MAIYLDKQSTEWKELFFELLHAQILSEDMVKNIPGSLTIEERMNLINWDKLFETAIHN
jgi:hypothetical protein